MSATALAMSAAANAQATAANIAAQEAAKIACAGSVRGYQHDTATVQQMRDYASCIGRLHPEEMTGGAMIALKAAILFVFIGMAVGVWKNREDSFSGRFERVAFGALCGFAVASGLVLSAGLVALGVAVLLA